MITNIFFGVLLVGAGIALLKYNFQVTNMFGHNNWFERNLGSGSSYFIFQIIGIFVACFGLLMILGLRDNFIDFLLSPLNRLFKPN